MCSTTPRAAMELPLSAHTPHLAREFVRGSLCAAHCSSLLDDAMLLASEAITNAVMHGAAPIAIAVDCADDTAEIRVRDGSPRVPLRRYPGESDTSGRGLMLIDLLSEAWGVDPASPRGKEVWFRLRARS